MKSYQRKILQGFSEQVFLWSVDPRTSWKLFNDFLDSHWTTYNLI